VAAVAADPTIRRQVISVARDVLEANADAPVASIARAAGVSRATFYRHFGSRGALLETIAYEPRPNARARILLAAAELLVRSSLADLSMDDLARAAGVSRGTLYRLYPGKAALLTAMIETYSPFEAMRAILAEHPDDDPEVVLPLIARAVVGTAMARIGLMRAVMLEVSSGSETSIAGIRPVFESSIAALGAYLARQMAAGRIRPMSPVLALQAFIGPIFFHLLTRPVVACVAGLEMDPGTAIDELTVTTLAGLRTRAP
jgi:AcrR family transcriptional regulator